MCYNLYYRVLFSNSLTHFLREILIFDKSQMVLAGHMHYEKNFKMYTIFAVFVSIQYLIYTNK